MFGRLGALLGLSSAGERTLEESAPAGNVDVSCYRMTREEAARKRKAKKANKAAKKARRRNRR